MSVLLLLETSKRSPLSKENLRNAILRAISIAVDPLSEQYVLEAHPAKLQSYIISWVYLAYIKKRIIMKQFKMDSFNAVKKL